MKGRGVGESGVIAKARKNKSSSGPTAMDKKISCRTKNWKYIYNWSGSEELNKFSEDPKESRDLASEKERVSEKKFRTKVKKHLE